MTGHESPSDTKPEDAKMTLTEASHEVFMTYAKDASNWCGRPWVTKGNIDCTNEMRGNLSDL